MPALNEEESIAAAIDSTLAVFDDCGIEGGIVVINDGSTDKTPDLVKKKMETDKRISLINHDRPMGIGASFWDGVNNADGDIVSMIPGDNENNPLETLRYAVLLEHVDIVIPFAFNKNVRSLARNILSSVYLFIINFTFMTNFHYTNSTLIYRKSILKQLTHRDSSFFYQTDILMRLVKMGYLFAEVPYNLRARKSGKSKAVSFSSFFKIIKGYLKLVKSIYFDKKYKTHKYKFTADSMSFKRYENLKV
jgi:glycosyltransferase involved in cell wall biosynthesis